MSSSLVTPQATTGSESNIFNLMFIEFDWYELLLCVVSGHAVFCKNDKYILKTTTFLSVMVSQSISGPESFFMRLYNYG